MKNQKAKRTESPSNMMKINRDANKNSQRVPHSQKGKTTGTHMPRKYSDNKYDNPDLESKIERQTLQALESLGLKVG